MNKYPNVKIVLLFMILVILSAFICCIVSFADVIGCDANGIVCLDNNLELYSNDFKALDLDFDGKHELYYFDVNGRLKTNAYISDYYINEKGQQTINDNVTIIDLQPQDINTYQIDNLDYYYINRVKSKFNENWEVQGIKEEMLKARVNIDLPEIAGVDKTIVKEINSQLCNRGLELLKLYAKEEVYKRNTRKFSITINKYVKTDVQKLCFVPMLNNRFYFKFDVIISLDNKDELHKNIGLCVDIDTCFITNNELQYINKNVYQNEDYVKNSNGSTYTKRYKDYIQTLKDEYIEALVDYIDKYADYIKEYEDKVDNSDRIIRAINNYIKNIGSVYNTYIRTAKKSYQNNEIDEETYKYIVEEFKEPLAKYKETLNNNLQIEINAIKELEIDKR